MCSLFLHNSKGQCQWSSVSPVSLYWPNMNHLAFRGNTSLPHFLLWPLSLTQSNERWHVYVIPLLQHLSTCHCSRQVLLQFTPGVPRTSAHRGHKMIMVGRKYELFHFIVILMCVIKSMLQNQNFTGITSYNETKAGIRVVSCLYWQGTRSVSLFLMQKHLLPLLRDSHDSIWQVQNAIVQIVYNIERQQCLRTTIT